MFFILKIQNELKKNLIQIEEQVNSLNESITTINKIKNLDTTTKKINKLCEDLRYLENQKELQNYIEISKKNSDKLEAIENSLNGVDIEFLKKLNKKIDKLLILKRFIVFFGIVIILIFLAYFIFFCENSPIYQKTKQLRIINNFIENHLKELSEKDDPIKALNECYSFLKIDEESQKTGN